MFKSLLNRMLPLTTGGERQVASGSPHLEYSRLVSRIIGGDADAETELVNRFGAGVFQIILRIVRNPPLAEDLTQDALITIIQKIRDGKVEHPESLNSFVASLARFHAIGQIRKIRRRGLSEDLEQAEQLPDPAPNRLEELQTSEQFAEMRDVIEELVPRYRELLLRFYINEEPKDVICADLGMSSMQFDGVLHRARKRYKELYLKRKGLAEKGGRR
jgi:RNA polymerase sigma-70 factor, ECF subfamily